MISRFAVPVSSFALAALAALAAEPTAAQSTCDSRPEVEVVGAGTPGLVGVPRLVPDGAAVPGRRLGFDVSGGLAGQHGCLFFGFEPVDVPLPQFGAVAHLLDPRLAAVFGLDERARAEDLFRLAHVPTELCGLELSLQAILLDPAATGSIAFSQGLRLRFGETEPGTTGSQSLPVGGGNPEPYFVSMDDLDGDGRDDLLVSVRFDDVCYVLLTRPDGALGTPQPVTVQDGSYVVELGDANGDGLADLLQLSVFENSFGVALGNGDGTFGPLALVDTGNQPYGVDLADFNGDGVRDAAIACAVDDAIRIHPGLGGGAFGPGDSISVGARPWAVESGDLDGNGTLDLVAPCRNSGELAIVLGAGDGTFGGLQLLPVGSFCSGAAIADLDGDGALDLVAARGESGGLGLFFNAGDGTSWTSVALGSNGPFRVQALDVVGDERPDLVTTESGLDALFVYENLGGGDFDAPRSLPTWPSPLATAIGDTDADGDQDLVAACSGFGAGEGGVTLLRGDRDALGDRTYGDQAQWPVGDVPDPLGVGDFDGDGLLDLVVGVQRTGSHHDGDLMLLFADGPGSFTPPIELDATSDPFAIAVDDLDRDGSQDVVAALFRADAIGVFRGSGDGTFQPPVLLPTPSPMGVCVGDFDGDGRSDLAAGDSAAGRVAIFRQTSAGEFVPEATLAAGGGTAAVQCADLDGDGHPDLVAVNRDSNSLSVYLGDGSAQFAASDVLPTDDDPVEVAIGDLNCDGIPDLAVTSYLGTTLSWFFGAGDGTFGPRQDLEVGWGGSDVSIAELTADHAPDLVVTLESRGLHLVLVGLGDGTFEPVRNLSAGLGAKSLELVDLDHDGQRDFVTTTLSRDAVRVRWNPLLR